MCASGSPWPACSRPARHRDRSADRGCGTLMDLEGWLPLFVLLTSLVTGLAIFFLREDQHGWRTTLNLAGAIAKLALVGVMTFGALAGVSTRHAGHGSPAWTSCCAWIPSLSCSPRSRPLLWLLTTIYAIGYLEGSPDRSRFFGFFSLCVTATMGVALAGNLITFFIFYEMLTVATYPLVVHRTTPRALAAGRSLPALHARRRHGPAPRRRVAARAGRPRGVPRGGVLAAVAAGHAVTSSASSRCSCRARREGGDGAAARLAAGGHGRAGPGQRAAARGRGGQGGRVRDRARRVRPVRARAGEGRSASCSRWQSPPASPSCTDRSGRCRRTS
jgi:hypothetical protein